LRLEAPAALDPCLTDRDKLRRVSVNLAANAVTFAKVGGSVTIRIAAGDSGMVPVTIEVEDTGIGIATERLAVIFEAFEQGDVGVGREYGGTGLGLSMSRALATSSAASSPSRARSRWAACSASRWRAPPRQPPSRGEAQLAGDVDNVLNHLCFCQESTLVRLGAIAEAARY
jgi:hypothetical protein